MLQITSPEFNPKTLVDLSNTQSFVPGHLNVRNTAKVAKKIYIHALRLNLLGLEVLPTISELPFSGLANSDKIVTVLACGVISDMILPFKIIATRYFTDLFISLLGTVNVQLMDLRNLYNWSGFNSESKQIFCWKPRDHFKMVNFVSRMHTFLLCDNFGCLHKKFLSEQT